MSGNAYFIDKTGSKVLVSKEKYKSFGLLVNGVIAAQKADGKYTYVDQSFNVLFGDYEYASTINNGVAAVKTGGSWQLIDETGKAINSEKYFDIKLDEKQIAYRSDRIFVSTSEGKYIMVDGKGKQVGSLVFEDAMAFAGDAPTAVKINGKWCLVGTDGKLISDKTYGDLSFRSVDRNKAIVEAKETGRVSGEGVFHIKVRFLCNTYTGIVGSVRV